jgi:PAS domain-containing protein
MSVLSIKKQIRTQPSAINDHMGVSSDTKIYNSEKEPAALMLDDNGMIHSCNQAGGELFGYSISELTGRHINKLFPQLAGVELVQDKRANTYLRFLSRIGHPFEAVHIGGKSLACELFFNDVVYLGRHCLRVIIRPVK